MNRRLFLNTFSTLASLAAVNPAVARGFAAFEPASFGDFDFGLSAEQETRARRLHRENPVVDLMFQGPTGYRSLGGDILSAQKQEWREKPSGEIFVKCLIEISRLAAKGQIPDYQDVWQRSGLTLTNLQVAGDIRQGAHIIREQEIAAYSDYRLIRSYGDIEEIIDQGKYGSFLNYQYLLPTINDLPWFEEARAVGIMMAGLTYNNPNQIGVGCTGEDTGLTAFGRQVVSKMNEVNMVVDTAHSGATTTIQACKVSGKPVIASHAGAAAVFMHARNKSDDELKALADTGGLCGMVTVPFYFAEQLPGSIAGIYDHIDYMVNLLGIDHVAVGTDWPMQLPRWVLAPDGPMMMWLKDMGFKEGQLDDLRTNVDGFDDYRDWPNITRGLVKRGYTDQEIAKIIGGNALRVLKEVWG